MPFISSVNRFLALLLDSLRQFAAGRIWLILIGYFALHWAVLYTLYDFSSAVFYGPVELWASLFDHGAQIGFTHYPGHFLLLPYFAGWTKFWLALIIEGSVLGIVASIIYTRLVSGLTAERLNFARGFFLWVNLSLVWLTLNGLALVVSKYVPSFMTRLTAKSPRMTFAVDFALLPAIYILIWGLFFVAIPVVVIYRENFLSALKRAVGVFVRNPLSSLVLAGLALIIPVTLNTAAGHSDFIIRDFRPEMVYWVLIAAYASEILANFFWMSSSVNLLMRDEEHL